MIYFESLSKNDLIQLLVPLGRDRGRVSAEKQARYRAQQIFKWVYARGVRSWDEMTDLSKILREWLKENVSFYSLKSSKELASKDGTLKFLWSLEDQKTIESVIIPSFNQRGEEENEAEWDRFTACISSQVGCAMKCKFCLTGVQGLTRNLKVYEIVSQIVELRKRAPLSNIVFMGMGEPLHNVDAVVKACEIFLDPDGFNFSKRKVTVSTSGLVPGIKKLGESVDVSLAISLNSTLDEQRSEIMPVNRKWNIEELLKTCEIFPTSHHRRVTLEYVLLREFNDSMEDAKRLVDHVKNLKSKVKINLIPFNEHDGSSLKRPLDQTVKDFQNYLISQHVTATVRISRGRDILAACGQLSSAKT